MIRLPIVALASALALAGSARGDLILTLGPAGPIELVPGGEAVFEASIRSTGGPERLDFFAAVFSISTVGDATPGALRFVDPPLGPPSFDPSYVFAGSSGDPTAAVTTDPELAGTANTLTLTDDSTGPDGVAVGEATRLLARFRVALGGSARAGDRYEIILDLGQSSFQDPDLGEIPALVFAPARVEVVAEPSSSLLIAAGLAGSALTIGRFGRCKARGGRG